jgi:hypothetical protein
MYTVFSLTSDHRTPPPSPPTAIPRHTLTEVAEEEDDLALMNLTALRRRPALYRYPLAQEIRAQHDPMEVV